ncbi:MAG TPA: sporulation membrane protein YtrI [Bacillus sp. (in: firmicutes)]|uniref:sporulation membrane protein YtrI n=1 Tax=Bacillus litorisediminis TaxID=2922713 RepID=UPI001FACE210|nr:sporulation membrane protein YtrI [Bacillus litorisediminis]HWO75491.1 sporulation membrane protein YtrI [Bacillus sp. (in: firmicutes)]
MRIPPFYRIPSWQRFLGGMALGGVISWMIFLYMFGTIQEKQASIIEEQTSKIENLNNSLKYWQEEYQKVNEELGKELTVEEIQIKLIRNRKLDLSLLQEQKIISLLEEDLNVLKAKKLGTIYDSKDLLKKAIETKVFQVDNKKYKLHLDELFLYTTLYIEVTIDLA